MDQGRDEMTNHTETDVTPEMLEAGIEALLAAPILEADEDTLRWALAKAFQSMERARSVSRHATR